MRPWPGSAEDGQGGQVGPELLGMELSGAQWEEEERELT